MPRCPEQYKRGFSWLTSTEYGMRLPRSICSTTMSPGAQPPFKRAFVVDLQCVEWTRSSHVSRTPSWLDLLACEDAKAATITLAPTRPRRRPLFTESGLGVLRQRVVVAQARSALWGNSSLIFPRFLLDCSLPSSLRGLVTHYGLIFHIMIGHQIDSKMLDNVCWTGSALE